MGSEVLDQLTREQVEHLFKILDDIENVFILEEEVRYRGDPIPATTIWAFSVLYQLVYGLWDATVYGKGRKNLDVEHGKCVDYGRP